MNLALEQHTFFVARAPRERLDSHREHLLLVEPNELWADVAIQSLENHGYRVTWMRSGREAIEALSAPIWSGRACPADLVLMDIDRPELNLVSFMRLLPELVRRVPPIVLIGAQPAELLSQTAEDVGATGFVCKPFAIDDLLITVRQSMRRTLA